MFKIICECDDGFIVEMAYTATTTCRELMNQLCQLRNVQRRSLHSFRAKDLSMVTTNAEGQIDCLLSPDVPLKKILDKSKTHVKVLGWETTMLAGMEGDQLQNDWKNRRNPSSFSSDEGDSGEENDSQEQYVTEDINRKRKRKSQKDKNVFTPDPLQLESMKAVRFIASDAADEMEWCDKFDMLLEYGRIYGHCNLARNVICSLADGTEVKLGWWVQHQRQLMRAGQLRLDRRERLQALANAGKLVLEQEVDPKDLFFPDPAELEKLRSLRINPSEILEDREWDNKFDMLLEYGRVYGTYNVPNPVICRLPDGVEVKLGDWLSRQRQYKKRGNLIAYRDEKLQQLVNTGKMEWEWEVLKAASDDEKWNRNFELLLQYSQEHEGSCEMTTSFVYQLQDGTDIKLGEWLYKQRQDKLKGKLRTDRETRLQVLVDQGRLQWSKATTNMSDDEVWYHRYVAMIKYGDAHKGNCNVPQSYVISCPGMPEIKLGAWLRTQRRKKSEGTLRADREEKLQALVDAGKLAWVMDGGQVTTDDESWNMQYDMMLQYGEEHNGNCNVPWTYVVNLRDGTEVRLGKWLADQRSKEKKGKLRKDRLEKLMVLVEAGRLRLRS